MARCAKRMWLLRRSSDLSGNSSSLITLDSVSSSFSAVLVICHETGTPTIPPLPRRPRTIQMSPTHPCPQLHARSRPSATCPGRHAARGCLRVPLSGGHQRPTSLFSRLFGLVRVCSSCRLCEESGFGAGAGRAVVQAEGSFRRCCIDA